MTPVLPMFSPMMPYGTGLTPQPVQNTNSLSLLEEQQRQQQQQQQAASQQQGGIVGTSGQTPQLYHSQAVSTTTALPGNTPLYTTPLTPMTPITPATPASESSGIIPQLQWVLLLSSCCTGHLFIYTEYLYCIFSYLYILSLVLIIHILFYLKKYCVNCELGMQTWPEDNSTASQECWV